MSYEKYDDEPITSDNWDCTGDCSGHDSGFEWAEENGIEDPGDCGGNSDSFIEGCKAYANEQMINNYEENIEEDYEEEEYDYY